MSEGTRPILIGLFAGGAGAALPGGAGAIVLVAGAVMAGWVLPSEPMRAAVLFVLPAIVIGAVRIVLNDETDVLPALLVGSIVALFVAAVFTHVGAGVALRRQQP